MARGAKRAADDLGPVEGPWDLPDDWRWDRLGECGDWSSGGTPSAKEPRYYGGSIPWLTSGELNDGVVSRTEKHITEEGYTNSAVKWLPPQTLLVAMYGATIGKAAITGLRCTTNQAVAACQPNAAFDVRYLLYFILSQRDSLRKLGQGGAQPNISQALLKDYPCPVAPVEVQRQIVARIDALFAEIDEGEAALAAAREGVETYRKALLKAAVTGELTADWRAANPPQESGEQLLHRILTDRRTRWHADPKNARKKYVEPAGPEIDGLPELPDGWTWATVQQLSTLVTSGSRGWSEYYADKGSLFIRAANLNRDRLDLSEIAFVQVPNNSEGARTKVKQGDFLITITGANVTKCGVVEQELQDAYVSQHVGLVRPVLNEIGRYFYLWSRSYGGGKQYLEDAAYGAGKPGLNLPNIYEMVVALPPLAEIAAIELTLQEAQDRVPEDDFIGNQGSQLRQSILAAAFRGDLTQ